MAKEFGARQDGTYLVICSMPDVCKMPNGVPVPFPIIQKLGTAKKVAKKTRFNGNWVVTLKSNTPTVLGDQAGVAKGVKSGSTGKKTTMNKHSKSVKVEGSEVIRVNDRVDMNNKNTQGKVVFAPAPQMGAITDTGAIE